MVSSSTQILFILRTLFLETRFQTVAVLSVVISGRDYVFDIKRTSREAMDYSRRRLFQMSQAVSDTQQVSIEETGSKAGVQGAEERCKVGGTELSLFLIVV